MSSSSLSVVRMVEMEEARVVNLLAARGMRGSRRPEHSVEAYCKVLNT